MKKLILTLAIMCVLNNFGYSQKIKVESIPQQPFLKYTAIQKSDTTTFYLSESKSKKPLPLIVFIQGSGNTSLFIANGGRIISQSGFMTFFDVAKGRCRILIVEKPGVK